MNRTPVYPVLLAALLTLSACAGHTLMRGSVAMKINDRSAHVCLGVNEVQKGDGVNLLRNECKAMGTKAPVVSCKKILIGTGVVTEVLNEHYSVFEFERGLSFEEGAVVETRPR